MYEAELALAKEAIFKATNYLEKIDLKTVINSKGKDIKLEADKNSEELILNTLSVSKIPTLSEENGALGDQNSYRWIIDPIDGTYNFFRGISELSSISIALWNGMEPILGVVNRLGIDQFFEGNTHKKKAFLNYRNIHTSSITELHKAAYATGFPLDMDYGESSLTQYIRAAQIFKKVRMLGAASIMSSFVGASFIDIYSENDIKLWDIAAGSAIAKAAGGEIFIQQKKNYNCHAIICANQQLLNKYITYLS